MSTTGFIRDETGLWIEKSPGASLAYTFDLKDPKDPWLATGETITTVTFTAATGLTVVQQSNTTTTATVKLSGGTAGHDYEVTIAWTTATGNEERFFTVKVRKRSA